MSLPLSLYSRSTGLVRWIELLVDGVITLTPFLHDVAVPPSSAKKGEDERPHGIIKIHKLPVHHERGYEGLREGGGDYAFVVSRRKFEIKEWSLPPVDNEEEEEGKQTKVDIEF